MPDVYPIAMRGTLEARMAKCQRYGHRCEVRLNALRRIAAICAPLPWWNVVGKRRCYWLALRVHAAAGFWNRKHAELLDDFVSGRALRDAMNLN